MFMLFVISLTPLSNSLAQIQKAIAKEIDEKLLEAVQDNDLDNVKNLISQGADINAKTGNGETPLHLAQSKEIAEFLISIGADIEAKDDEFGMTPLFNAPKEVFELPLQRYIVK